jgi:hypothetical protein
MGFLYSITPEPVYDGPGATKLTVQSASNTFVATATGLYANGQYYVRAFFKNSAGIAYSDEEGFLTPDDGNEPSLGEVDIVEITDIKTTSATFTLNLKSISDSPADAE